MKDIRFRDFSENAGKFIQVYVKEEPYLWLGSSKLLHGHIFNDLLNKLEIPYSSWEEGFKDEEGKYCKIQIPEKKGELYSLVGAGSFYRDDKGILLWKNSLSYGVGPDKDHAKKVSDLTDLEFSF